MNTRIQFAIVCLVGSLLTAAARSADGPADYLTGEGSSVRLKAPLILREEQGGIAGTTGTIRTIQENGEWSLVEFQTNSEGVEEKKTIKSGRLSPEGLTALASDLAKQDLTGLPEKLGEDEPVNPHRVIIQFGPKRTTLSGVAPRLEEGETTQAVILKSASGRGIAAEKFWKRCADVADAVESRVAPPKK